MALMSWKHIETQSLFCTGLHESKWWKHQVLGNLVNESVKLSHIQVWRKTQLLALAVFHNLHAFETCPKQVGSLNPKSFIMGSEFWIRSCFQEAFFQNCNQTATHLLVGSLGRFLWQQFPAAWTPVPVYWPCYVEKLSNTNFFIKANVIDWIFLENQLRAANWN